MFLFFRVLKYIDSSVVSMVGSFSVLIVFILEVLSGQKTLTSSFILYFTFLFIGLYCVINPNSIFYTVRKDVIAKIGDMYNVERLMDFFKAEDCRLLQHNRYLKIGSQREKDVVIKEYIFAKNYSSIVSFSVVKYPPAIGKMNLVFIELLKNDSEIYKIIQDLLILILISAGLSGRTVDIYCPSGVNAYIDRCALPGRLISKGLAAEWKPHIVVELDVFPEEVIRVTKLYVLDFFIDFWQKRVNIWFSSFKKSVRHLLQFN